MDMLALVVGVSAIVAAMILAVRSSVRNEAHHQVTVIQELLKEISEVTHVFFLDVSGSSSPKSILVANLAGKALAYESRCSMKCDLLESSLVLLVRRCSRVWFFDADVEVFHSDFIELLGRLRDALSSGAYSNNVGVQSVFTVDAHLVRLHIRVNDYIGERFRPIFET
ncbi:hypothetical protein [Pseudomonas sp. SDO558_S425]